MEEKVLWGIHAGKTGDADSLFLKKNLVAIGWSQVGDLGRFPPDREAFKQAIAATYPDIKRGAIPNNAGQLYRFVHEMQIGDYVAYPSKSDKHIHLGKITGSYQYDPVFMAGYPNQRSVTWLKKVPRTDLSQGALYEIGSAMSLFQIKSYADEFFAALAGELAPVPAAADETVALVVSDIEQTTRDYIMKTLAQEFKGHPFAVFVAHLLNTMGYRTRVAPPGPDGGIDIIAHRDELGFEPPIIKVQVKSSDGSIGLPIVSALYGNVDQNEHGLLVILGSFTNQAKGFAAGKSNLRLIDGDELIDLILAHYEQLNSRYKGTISLKRVYIPDQEE
jgi:restriction system protein